MKKIYSIYKLKISYSKNNWQGYFSFINVTIHIKMEDIKLKLYITRHGQTKWNTERRMQGWNNSDLTELGIENAKKLGESLKSINFGVIYTSPLGRTMDTAKYIRGDKNTPIIEKVDFREMGFGTWEGMTHTELEQLYPTEYDNFWNTPHLFKAMDGESYEDLFKRVEKGLNEIISNTNHDNILLVTHTAVIKAIFSIVNKISLESFWEPPYIKDTCLTILEITDGKMKIILEADVSHLIN